MITLIQSVYKETLPFSKKEIWDIITNNTNYEWRTDLEKIEIVDETHFVEIDLNHFQTNFNITKMEAMTLYEFQIQNKNLNGIWSGELKEINNDSTEVTFTEQIEVNNLLMKLLAKSFLKKQQKRYFKDLLNELEKKKNSLK